MRPEDNTEVTNLFRCPLHLTLTEKLTCSKSINTYSNTCHRRHKTFYSICSRPDLLNYIYLQNDFITALRKRNCVSFKFYSQNKKILKASRLFSILFSQIVLKMVIHIFCRSKCCKLKFLKILSLQLMNLPLWESNFIILLVHCCHKVMTLKRKQSNN